MATEVKLPQLGQTMEEGTIVGCLVKVGDKVSRGDVIFEVETDKATLEMESPADGFVKYIAVEIGQTLPVGDVVAILGGEDEKIDVPSAQPDVSAAPTQTDTAQQPASTAPAQPVAAVEIPADANVVKLPQLGQTMEEGTIVNYLVKVGDEVDRGDVILEVETDKATLEMESPAGGFVKCILAETGQTIPVVETVIILADKDTDIPQSFIDSLKGTEPTPEISVQPAPASTPSAPAVKPQSTTATGRVIASPRARKLANQLGVNMATVTGTGPLGRIVEKDIEAASKAAPAAAAGGEYQLGQTIPVNRLQKITAKRMLQSKLEIPCFYLTVKADVTDLVDYRTKLNGKSGVKVSYNDFIIRAVAIGLENFPIMTGQLDGDNIKLTESIGVGLAISVPDGLVAPIAKNVNKKTVTQIANDTKTLVEKARNNKLAPTDLEGGCITVSNLGAFGIDSFIPIVVPGQCSILGVGQISDTLIPDNGNLLVRKLMSMTLSVDHKVANGAYAAQFLDFVRKILEDTSNFD